MLTWQHVIYFLIAVCPFKVGLSPESKVLFPDSFENMIGNSLRAGGFAWCYDEVFKHHINGASIQTKAIALQWEHHKIPSCYLGNQVISTDSSAVGTDLLSFKEVTRNSMKSRKCHYLDRAQVNSQIYLISLNSKRKKKRWAEHTEKKWIMFPECQKCNRNHNLPVLLRSL